VLRCFLPPVPQFKTDGLLGRFLEEDIYQREIVRRLSIGQIEVPLTAAFDGFSKSYYLDLLVESAAIFEFKVVESLGNRHRAQLLHYLLLAELPHGKLVNLRSDLVEHEFINATLTREDRTDFEVFSKEWQTVAGEPDIREWTIAAVRDWGTGLDVALYEEAVTHRLGGYAGETEIILAGRVLGRQAVLLTAPNVAFKVTAIPQNAWKRLEDQIQRFLALTPLKAIHWVNVVRGSVSFKTFRQKNNAL
jgi:GxxExxY protein